MTSQPFAPWERPYFADSDGAAFLFFVAFGDIKTDVALDSKRYRCAGIPAGIDLVSYGRAKHGAYLAEFEEGYLWDRLVAADPDLARQVQESPGCVILRGELKNPETLDYLRDAVGLLTYLLDCGACAIYDPQQFEWWSPRRWRERIFEPAAPVPRHHVVVLFSEEEDSPGLLWFHTRGLRKFGRPDISVHRVNPVYRDAVVDLCERFIELQAFGGVIAEGETIRMRSLPPGGTAFHGGDLDDADFNNVHVEIVWPGAGLSS